MELATFLYKAKVTCARRDSDGDDDFNLEAIMELVSSLAPNLKDLTILNLYPMRSGRYLRSRDSWKGLPGFNSRLQTTGTLTSLSLKGYSRLSSPTPLRDWARYRDFSYLQHLTLGGGYTERTCGLSGETLEWMAQNYSFPQLRTLSVYLYHDYSQDRLHYTANAVSFFQAFESLRELSIDGPIDSPIFDTVLSHHGNKLQKLSLRPFEQAMRDDPYIPMEFTKDHFIHIQVQCPVLEVLAIPVKRKKIQCV